MDGWLEPLLERIMQDDTVITVPVIDTIDYNTFEYGKGNFRFIFLSVEVMVSISKLLFQKFKNADL